MQLRGLPCHAKAHAMPYRPYRPSCYDIHAATLLQLVCKPVWQCTLQLQFYQKSRRGCIVVVFSTPAIMDIIIWWVHDSVVDRYTVFANTKSVIYTMTVLLISNLLGFIFWDFSDLVLQTGRRYWFHSKFSKGAIWKDCKSRVWESGDVCYWNVPY